ncbi:hypothetical protein BKA65DRAFT_547379 [Rhexocercosporidium sp. MPI-PUGE-AT-0058]|nr:hypothetical protein BKA65DRAFT_547379 [Rhexocercosporidium sp. MPI-PUGE-AT-0058]
MSVWNPRAILSVYPEDRGFHCLGHSKNDERCNYHIKRHELDEAGVILDSLALVPLQEHFRRGSVGLREILHRLAALTLCRRWHRRLDENGQTVEVVNRWWSLLRLSMPEPYQRLRRLRGSVAVSSTSTSSYPLSPTLPPPTFSSRNPQPGLSTTVSPQFGLRAPSPSLSTTSTRTSNATLPSARSSSRMSTPDPTSPSERNTISSTTSSRTQSRETNLLVQHNQRHGSSAGVVVSGPIRAAGDVNLNITINSQPAGVAHRSSHGRVTNTNSSSSSGQFRTPPPSPPALVPHHISSVNSVASTTISERPLTHNDIRALLDRIESLETQLQQANSRRSSTISSNPGLYPPSTPALSNISDISIPPPTNPAILFFSPPQSSGSPLPGTLSISTDPSTSPTMMTPTLSGSSSPTLPSSPLTPPRYIPAPSTWYSPSPPNQPHTRPPLATTASQSCAMCLHTTLPTTSTHCHNPACLKTYCASCLNSWLSSQLEDNRVPSCPFCRASWVF